MIRELWKLHLITFQGSTFQVVCSEAYVMAFLEEYESLMDDQIFRLIGVSDTADQAKTVVVLKKDVVAGITAFEI